MIGTRWTSKPATGEGEGSGLRVEIILPIVAAVAVAYMHFNFIQDHFATGAYRDAGWFVHLVFRSSILLENPRLTMLQYGSTFYSAHISPILFLLSLPSYVLPFNRISNIGLVFGLQSALLVLSGAMAVLALRLQIRPILLGALAALAGVTLYFSAQSLLAVSFPHYEPVFAALAILFFVAYATGRHIWAAFLFALVLAVREETGFHIFGVIFLLILYERFIDKAGWERLRGLAIYGLVGFAYSSLCVLAHRHFFPGGGLFEWTYTGEPPYAHLTREFFIERLGLVIVHRLDLVFGLAATAVLAYACKRPQYLLGYAAFLPWAALNVLAIREAPGKLHLHYGYPFVLALAWPIVYEVLKTRWIGAGERATLRGIEGAAADRGSDGFWPRRRMAAVLATIAICAGTMGAAPHALWVIGRMTPVGAETHQAIRVLMDFLDQGWADELGMRTTEGAAAVSPDTVGQQDTVGRRPVPFGGAGLIFFTTEFHAPQALRFAMASGFDGSFRLGGSSIQFAFRSNDRERIRRAIEQANEGRVRVEERSTLYASLRAGPAGTWVGDRLLSAPKPIAGLVAYGPYVDLEPGHYRMTYRLRLVDCQEPKQQLRIRLAVTADFGRTPSLTRFGVTEVDFPGDGCVAQAGTTFTVTERALGRAIEFPIWTEGAFPFWIEDISLIRDSSEGEPPVRP